MSKVGVQASHPLGEPRDEAEATIPSIQVDTAAELNLVQSATKIVLAAIAT
jgi:hypothetical protein